MPWPAWVVYTIVQVAVSLALMILTAKAPKTNIKAKGLDDFDFPTATEDREIMYLCGDVLMDGPNLGWYGDLATRTLTKKVATSGFNTNHKNVPVGIEYYVGFELILGFGVVDELTEIWFEEKLAWTGTVTGASSEFSFANLGLFGGKQNGGGVKFRCSFRNGSLNQPIDPYMAAVDGFNVAPYGYRHLGVSKLIFRGPSHVMSGAGRPYLNRIRNQYPSGMVGETPSVRPIKCRLKRYPNNLGVPSNHHRLLSGANPACVLYELVGGTYLPFNTTRTTPGLEPYEIELSTFLDAAEVLYNEDMGISFKWMRDAAPRDIIDDILLHINGTLRENPSTGKVDLVLFRATPDISSLPRFNRGNCLEVVDVQRQTIDSNVNRVKYSYTDTVSGFPVRTASVFSNAGLFMAGREASVSLDLTMFHNPAVANRRAQTHLNSLCCPLFSGGIVTDMRGWDMKIGDRFVLDWESGDPDIASITNMVCMVNKVDYGKLDQNRITLGFTQDLFSLGSAVFHPPEDPEWEAPSGVPGIVEVYKVAEMPQAFLGSVSPNVLAVWAEEPDDMSLSMEVAVQLNNGGYYLLEDPASFSPSGFLLEQVYATGEINVASSHPDAILADMTAFIYDDSYGVEEELRDVDYLVDATETNLNTRKVNIFLVDNELIGVVEWAEVGENTHALRHVVRGLYGTQPAAHYEGARLWKVSQALFLLDNVMPTGADWDLKLREYNYGGSLELEEIPEISGEITGYAALPYMPGDLSLNSVKWDTTVALPINFEWIRRNKANTTNYHSSQITSSFGESYELDLVDPATDDVLRTYAGTDNEWDYTALMSQEDGDIEVLEVRIRTIVDTVASPDLVFTFQVTEGWLP